MNIMHLKITNNNTFMHIKVLGLKLMLWECLVLFCFRTGETTWPPHYIVHLHTLSQTHMKCL